MSTRSFGLLVLLAVAVLAGCGGLANASDWPRFRGPNGTGVSDDKNVPLSWEGRDAALWKLPIEGAGNSSPVVSKQRIFLQSATADQRRLLCVELNSGKLLWEKSAPGATARTHQKNTLASGTPAIDGTHVYVTFWDGANVSVAAFDFDGKLAWSRELGGYVSQHGAGMSPMIVGGKVVLLDDQDGSAAVIALSCADGGIAWKSPRPAHRACYSTPFLMERRGKPELVVANTAGFAGYDPESGAELWNWTWSGNKLRTVGSPVAAHGILFISSGDGSGDRSAVAVRLNAKGATAEPELLWENRKLFPYVPSMLTAGDHLYFVNDTGVAACHVASTGKPVWTQRLGGNFTASPILVDGNIYAINEQGHLFVFSAAAEFKQLGESDVGEGVMASPAVADSRLLIRGKSHLFCFGKPNLAAAPTRPEALRAAK